jgi:ABC-type glycerol-3-phosphate transport system permease component
MKKFHWLLYVLQIIFAVIVCIPFAWMIDTSLKPYSEIYAVPPHWAIYHLTWQWYHEAIQTGIFGNIWNSIQVAILTVVLTMFFAILAAYAFSRLQFRGKQFLLNILLTSQMLPQILFVIPIFRMYHTLHLLNNYLFLSLSYLVFTVPVGTWMLKGFFDALPKELEEAASIDGCSRIGILWKVVLPLSLPAIVSVSIYAFLLSWSEFMFALTFITNPSKATLPVILSTFITEYQTRWGDLMASSFLATIPALVIFGFLQKYFVKGLTEGAVKE